MAGKSKGTVGVIGRGIMGGAFARNLAAAGWRVVGYDISAARRREAQGAGVEIADSPVDVAARSPTIITSLPKPQALMDVAGAIAKAKLKSKTIVEMSTFTISDKEKAEKVFAKTDQTKHENTNKNTKTQTKKHKHNNKTSGNTATIRKLKPMFEAFGRTVYD